MIIRTTRSIIKLTLVLLVLAVFGLAICQGAKSQIERNDDYAITDIIRSSESELADHQVNRRGDVRERRVDGSSRTTIAFSDDRSEGRFFLKVSDIIVEILQQHIESLPPPVRGPLMFLMGFSQQSVENIVSSMRSFGQMIVASLVLMVVKRIYFSNLPTVADRNGASELTDSILDMLHLFSP